MKSKGNAILVEWPVLRLGLPTFPFREYIWRYSGVLSLDWFGLWSWEALFSKLRFRIICRMKSHPWTVGPSRPCCGVFVWWFLVRCVSCSPLPLLNTSLFASLFYTLSQDLLGRGDLFDWTSGLRDAVGGSRMMPSFGRLVLFCTLVLFRVLVCTLYSRHFCVVW